MRYNSYEEAGIVGINYSRSGDQKVVCPKCADQRRKKRDPSLSVSVLKGVWNCHHCGWSGRLSRSVLQAFDPPDISATLRIMPVDDDVVEWFAGRGISKETLAKANVCRTVAYSRGKGMYVGAIGFPIVYSGKIISMKTRTREKEFSIYGGQRVLWNVDSLEGAEVVVITEGEIDALSFIEAGFDAVASVPDGAPAPNSRDLEAKMAFLDNCIDRLDAAKTVYLATDGDPPGLRLREELARRIGKDRCFTVPYPSGCKDANDVLVQHGPERLLDCLEVAEACPLEGVYVIDDFAADVLSVYSHGFPKGARTGWDEFDNLLTIHPGMVTTVTGPPGHGKSSWLDNVLMRLACRFNWRHAVYSPEQTPDLHAMRLLTLIWDKPFLPDRHGRMTEKEVSIGMDMIRRSFWWIVGDGELYDLDKILEHSTVLVRRVGIRSLTLDPWNTIEHRGEGTNTDYVSDAMSKIKIWATKNDCHVFVVAHPRKLEASRETGWPMRPSLYDISGSANFFNKTDNGLVVYRPDQDKPIVEVTVGKVKHSFQGHTGRCNLRYLPHSQRVESYTTSTTDTLLLENISTSPAATPVTPQWSPPPEDEDRWWEGIPKATDVQFDTEV